MWTRLTVVYGPVDKGIRGHPHEGEVGEVHLRKVDGDQVSVYIDDPTSTIGEVVVFVDGILARIQYKDGKVVRIFMRKRNICRMHRTPKLSILSAGIRKLNDDRHPVRSRHHNPILFQETGWIIAGGEEDVESAKRENSEVEQM